MTPALRFGGLKRRSGLRAYIHQQALRTSPVSSPQRRWDHPDRPCKRHCAAVGEEHITFVENVADPEGNIEPPIEKLGTDPQIGQSYRLDLAIGGIVLDPGTEERRFVGILGFDVTDPSVGDRLLVTAIQGADPFGRAGHRAAGQIAIDGGVSYSAAQEPLRKER